MKIMKSIIATVFAISFIIVGSIESTNAAIKKKGKSSGDSNQTKILEFDWDSTQPGIIKNLVLRNPFVGERGTKEEIEVLIERGTTPNQIFGQDNEATVSIYSRQNLEEDSLLGETYSQLITFDVDELSFSSYPNGELTLYWLVPKTIEPSTINNLSDLLSFSVEDIQNSLNAVFEKDRTNDVYKLDANEGEFSSESFPFEDNPNAEPWGAQLNAFEFDMNITEESESEKIPEPNTTISLLCLAGGVFGIKLLPKHKSE
jgi:hypothetical protein